MVLHDQHVHSEFSEDSTASLVEYYNIAKSLGCKYFVTTEHIDLDVTMSKKDWVVDYKTLKEVLNNTKTSDGPIPLLGVELGFRRDYLKELKAWLASESFDVINLSVHDSGKLEYYFVDGFKEIGLKNTMKIYYDQMYDAISTMDEFTTLSHIDYAFKTACKIDPNYDFLSDKEMLVKILKLLIKKGKALEINTKVQEALPLSHTIELLNLYKSLGGKALTLSSDAHQTKRYLSSFDKYKKIIKQCGFNYLCYFIKQKEYHFDI